MNLFRSSIPTLAVMALLTACGGGTPTDNGGGGGGGGAGGGGGGGGVDPRMILANPVFSTDIQLIFLRNCTAAGCHGLAMSGRLGLSNAAESYTNLVYVPSFNSSELGLNRVQPFDTLKSYLWLRLSGGTNTLRRMPQGASALDDVDLTNIMNWINNGAPNDLDL